MVPRTFLSLCAVVAAAVAIAGCGGSGSSAASGTATSSGSVSGSATTRTAAAVTGAGTPGVVYRWGSFGTNRRANSRLPNRAQGGGGNGGGGGGRGQGGGGGGGHHHRHRGARGRQVARTPVPVPGIHGTVSEVATSNSDGYALTTSGAVYAWGVGAAGELGNGTKTARTTRAVQVHLPAGVRIRTLPDPMPFDGGMAIDTHGDVWGWGNDQDQELCLPQPADLDTPVKLPLSDVSLAVGAQRHALYDSHGHVESCGYGQDGQLGNGTSGTTALSATPVSVRGLPAGRVTALTSGYGDAGVVMADGSYYDWGLNNHGQVGDGSRTNATTAVHVHLPSGVRRIFEGGSVADNGQALALLANGQLWEWGAGGHGQMGDGTTSDSLSPRQISLPSGAHAVSVGSGGSDEYAVTASGMLEAWGTNAQGELGNGSSARMASRPVTDALRVREVASTAGDVAALGGAPS